MYLKKIEINGFKSFANKTTLDFLPECNITEGTQSVTAGKPASVPLGGTVAGKCGITAIVGPNGSGKSNVADAIRWAIGEQSSKNLRGKKSEDVIFAGTDKKARLGTAAVTLHFDNSDKRIPIEFAEVAITRKIYRSGESEYIINGSRVRLLDVVDLLAKAGIGKDSYCVITQGMSDAALNAVPSERRVIFEDAAGVKQYQIEKSRALRKLDSTRENLERANGLIAEIEPHLKNLRRQAEKAAQGKEIAEKLRAKQILLYGFLWHNFQGERDTLVKESAGSQKEIFDLEVKVNTLSREVATASQAIQTESEEEKLGRELDKVRAETHKILRDKTIVEGKIEIEREKLKLQEVTRVVPVDLNYVRAALQEIEKHQEELISRIKSVEKLEDLQDIREFAQVIKQRLYDLYKKAGAGSVKEKKIAILSDTEKKAGDEKMAVFIKEKNVCDERLAVSQKMIAEKEQELSRLRAASRQSRQDFFAKEKEWREKEYQLARLKDQLNEIKVRLARVEVREEDLIKLVREELSIDVKDLQYDASAAGDILPPAREKLEREIARLKVEAEHIGGIDPLVVDEYRETEKRYDFLTRESADLKQAMESLKAVAKEMEQKIDKIFNEAFEQIRKNFTAYFKLIFGGGKAELKIVKIKHRRAEIEMGEMGEKGGMEKKGGMGEIGEMSEGEKWKKGEGYGAGEGEEEGGMGEEEREEVGIEILACPPGKKITNLSMLSGGERALTSLALLFAIISHNPPPFAVLDEVEATLDEANSRRFGAMLRELSSRTQFVAITHNRETMSQAGLIYGVTMGADGVSQLLSIRLDQVVKNGGLVDRA